MRDLRRYLTHPYYWRRAMRRIFEKVVRQVHLETRLDQLVGDDLQAAHSSLRAGERLPGNGTRLLYVAPKFDYGNPARGYSYEENHFLPALTGLGFNVIRFDSLALVGRLGKRAASDLLAEVAFRVQPEIAFFVLFKDDFHEEAVEELKRLGCVTFNWFTDDHWRFESFSSRWAPRFSWAITTHAEAVRRYQERGATNVIRSQWAVNHRLYRPLDRLRRYQATFIGQPHGDRRQIVNALQRAGIAVEAWGYGWPRGKLSTRQMIYVINESAVNLNLSNASVGAVDQIKGRDFEVPACRGLLLSKSIAALEEYYAPGKDILTFATFEDLVDKIRWALAHPQEADHIRESGYRRALRDHTYESRFLEVFRAARVIA